MARGKRSWSHSTLETALSDVKSGACESFAAAERRYGIPASTLGLYYHGRNSKYVSWSADGRAVVSVPTLGRPLALGIDGEKELHEKIAFRVRGGAPPQPRQVILMASEILCSRGRTYKKAGREIKVVSRKWTRFFLKRHRDLSLKTPQKIDYARVQAEREPGHVAHFFEL